MKTVNKWLTAVALCMIVVLIAGVASAEKRLTINFNGEGFVPPNGTKIVNGQI